MSVSERGFESVCVLVRDEGETMSDFVSMSVSERVVCALVKDEKETVSQEEREVE